MKRLPIILAAVVILVALGVLSSIVTQGFEDMARAEDERQRLENEKQRLESEIEVLEDTLEALESDPEAAESMARKELRYIRPGETVVILATPTPALLPIVESEATPTPILTLPD
ncbi:MAG: septum formation initiator family protein [Thermoanaerobaculales bacterium]|jgi:cell division protein FtsB|nr:septum formation initiator family protein [Thermoanaerobaculales bacterium]